jgi:predicted Fe-Mo cluster-binding NifX family protein
MKICFPVQNDQGLDSKVFGHFGSAPQFVVVDSETREVGQVVNRDLNHQHGSCSPLKALGGQQVDAIVVGGIGGGALMGLRRAGMKVYQAGAVQVGDNLNLLGNNQLIEIGDDMVCSAHDHGQGHGHGKGKGLGQSHGHDHSHSCCH